MEQNPQALLASTYTILFYYGKIHSDVTLVAACHNHSATTAQGSNCQEISHVAGGTGPAQRADHVSQSMGSAGFYPWVIGLSRILD